MTTRAVAHSDQGSRLNPGCLAVTALLHTTSLPASAKTVLPTEGRTGLRETLRTSRRGMDYG